MENCTISSILERNGGQRQMNEENKIPKFVTDLTNYLIERTMDLFKIAKNMEVTEKTLIFIMILI